jgi:hypothetical protein
MPGDLWLGIAVDKDLSQAQAGNAGLSNLHDLRPFPE